LRSIVHKSVNILLTSASYSEHKGSAAILISTIDSLKRTIPHAHFLFLSWTPQLDIGKIKRSNVYVISIQLPRSIALLLGAIYLRVFRFFKQPLEYFPILHCLHKADIILDIGGDTFSTIYGKKEIISHGALILSAKLLKKPIVLYCQTIGPFGKLDLTLAKQFLKLVDLIIVREHISANYLKRLGLQPYICADPAFLLKPSSAQAILKILNKNGVNCDKPIIGINLSQHIDRLCGGDSPDNKYRIVMSELIDHLQEHYNAQVLIVPEVIGSKPNSYDDIYVSRKVVSLLRHKERVTILKDNYSPCTLKRIVGCCDIFISARFHLIIFAISMHVPAISISYSHKAHGIMEMVEQGKYVLPYKNLNIKQLIEKVEDIWLNRDKVRRRLEIKMMEVRKQAYNACKLVGLLINRKLLVEGNDP
jgi:colanic acid/amylovoran biosynthesis protein